MWISVYQVQDGLSVGQVSESPPYKRVSRMVVPSVDGPGGGSESSVSHATPATTLDSLIREAHSQYHDRLRELRRDCQLMARHYLQQRDDKISYYTRNLSAKCVSAMPQLLPSTSNDLNDFDLDIVKHA